MQGASPPSPPRSQWPDKWSKALCVQALQRLSQARHGLSTHIQVLHGMHRDAGSSDVRKLQHLIR